MSAERMTERQRMALSVAIAAQHAYRSTDQELSGTVRYALEVGVPILTLSRSLGVSRTRIRTLARAEGEHE